MYNLKFWNSIGIQDRRLLQGTFLYQFDGTKYSTIPYGEKLTVLVIYLIRSGNYRCSLDNAGFLMSVLKCPISFLPGTFGNLNKLKYSLSCKFLFAIVIVANTNQLAHWGVLFEYHRAFVTICWADIPV